MALDPDLPDGLAGGAGGCRRGRATGPESGRSGTHAARGSQAAQTEQVHAWTDEQVTQFMAVSADHRWAVAIGVLYRLRRFEVLALKWDDLDAAKGTLRIDEGLVPVRRGRCGVTRTTPVRGA